MPPFERHLGDLAGLLAPYAFGSLVVADRHTYEVAANWKVIAENYHECYHCPLIHPELCQVSPPDSGENYDLPGAWVGGSMDLRDGMATMSLDGSLATPLPGVDPQSFPPISLPTHTPPSQSRTSTRSAPARRTCGVVAQARLDCAGAGARISR